MKKSGDNDLVIKNGQALVNGKMQGIDLAIAGEKISLIAPDLKPDSDTKIIDASGKLVLPGFIDCHTHMGIPIKDTFSADDFFTGSIAAACGGITTVLDFTVQQENQSLQASADERRKAAAENSVVDFGIHVNITNQPEKWLSQIPALIEQGYSSFKVFSTYREAGMMADWQQFRQILATVNQHGGLLLLHAEDNDLVESTTRRYLDENKIHARYHGLSRTAEAEAKAIERAGKIARELSASLYIVHVSSEAGLNAGLNARRNGANIRLETCPQYLVLNDSCYEKANGHYYIATPPLRKKSDSEALWQALANGDIDTIGTDHCPFTTAQKNSGGGIFHQTANGLPGVETAFPLLYTYGVMKNQITLERLMELMAVNPAKLFGLSHQKGEIKIGNDADLVIWDPRPAQKIEVTKLHSPIDWSPYEGWEVTGKLDYTILRGKIIVDNTGCAANKGNGQFIAGKITRM